MRKDRDSRSPQRRGFDDNNDSPPRDFGFPPRESDPRFEASPVQATVKWYNPDKGFGFVGLPTGGDAFLHVSVVERSGSTTVLPGATLEVRIASSQKGMQVAEILSVDTSPLCKSLPGVPVLSPGMHHRTRSPSRSSAR